MCQYRHGETQFTTFVAFEQPERKSKILYLEPVMEMEADVEIVLKSAVPRHDGLIDVFDLIASLPAGFRTKEDIDAQVREERNSWGER